MRLFITIFILIVSVVLNAAYNNSNKVKLQENADDEPVIQMTTNVAELNDSIEVVVDSNVIESVPVELEDTLINDSIEVNKQDTLINDSTLLDEALKATAPQDKIAPEEEEDNSLYIMVEVMPEFPGGIDSMKVYINSHINYKKIVNTKNLDDMARIEFVVEKDGSLSNFGILKSSGNTSFDKEALRVVKMMPSWTPGELFGKLVRTKIIIPVWYNH